MSKIITWVAGKPTNDNYPMGDFGVLASPALNPSISVRGLCETQWQVCLIGYKMEEFDRSIVERGYYPTAWTWPA